MIFQLVGFQLNHSSEILYEGDSFEELLRIKDNYTAKNQQYSFRVYGKEKIVNKWREMFWI